MVKKKSKRQQAEDSASRDGSSQHSITNSERPGASQRPQTHGHIGFEADSHHSEVGSHNRIRPQDSLPPELKSHINIAQLQYTGGTHEAAVPLAKSTMEITVEKFDKKHKRKSRLSPAVSPRRRSPPPQTAADFQRRFNNMLIYILKDAYEKAEEIDIKTIEDARDMKAEYKKKLQTKVDQEFTIREHKILNDVRTAISLIHNAARLQEINAKQDHIEDLRELVAEQITIRTNKTEEYKKVLQNLIMEGLYKLMGSPVTVRCREKDKDIVNGILSTVAEDYKKKTNHKMELLIDKVKYLPADCLGGVYLTVDDERITLKNTFDAKLDQILQSCIPPINISLFGANENRKWAF